MHSRHLLAGLQGLLVLAALPAQGQEQDPPFAVTARMGAQVPARLFSPAPPDLGIGPSVELAVSRALLPWLEVELAAGWSRSTAPTQSFLLPGDPADPNSPLVLLTVAQRLTTVPVFANLRARWPSPWAVRPYLVAGGGGLHADLRIDTGSSSPYPSRDATGWAPVLQAGFGADLRPGSGLLVGVEARWRWGHATLRERLHPSPYTLFGQSRSGDADLGGFCAQATAGWRF